MAEAALSTSQDISYHARLVDMFEDAEDASDKSRTGAQVYVDYYDGKQWTEKEKKALEKRGQPVITWNRVREKIDYLQGAERERRTKPRALPRTPQHEEDSNSATDALQYVYDDTRYDQLRSRAWGDILKAGWGGVEIGVEERAPSRSALMGSSMMTPSGPEYSITCTRCAWDRMFWDPHSSEDDFSDAGYLGLVLWMDRDEAIRRYGEDAAKVFDATVRFGEVGNSYDDKPKYVSWVSGTGTRQRVRVVQIYFIDEDGGWSFAEYTRGGILKDGPSPWMDEDGETEHPYCWRAAYVDRDNNRYGPIRDMVDLQDEINKRRSKALHHFTSRQTFGNQKFSNVADNKKQLARPDGHVELQGQAEFGKDFGILPTNDQAQGHFELLSQATGAFETVGPNAAMQGKKGKSESGRAILAQQQGGALQMGTLTDLLRQMDMDAYRKMWNRIRQFWTGETWVRVTDDEKNVRFVALNQPMVDEWGNQVGVQNDISNLDVDIIVDDAPDGGVLLTEQFELLVQLKQMDANGEIPFRDVIAAAPFLRNKAEILKGIDERAQQPPDPMQVAGAQAEVADIQASAAQKQSSAVKNMADAEKTRAEIPLNFLSALMQQQAAPQQPGPF